MFRKKSKTLHLKRSLARDHSPAGYVHTLPLSYTEGSPCYSVSLALTG
jgi:hypothetical protein